MGGGWWVVVALVSTWKSGKPVAMSTEPMALRNCSKARRKRVSGSRESSSSSQGFEHCVHGSGSSRADLLLTERADHRRYELETGAEQLGAGAEASARHQEVLGELDQIVGRNRKACARRVYGMRTAHGAECARRVHGMRTARRLPLDASSAASSRNIGSSSTLSSTRTTEAQAAPRRAKRLPHARGVACCVRACGATYPLLSEISTSSLVAVGDPAN